MKHIIPWVPDDLVVRVVRRIKIGEARGLIKAMELTGICAQAGVNVGLVRRLVCLVKLDSSEWSGEDGVWAGELIKAEKALMGVWSGRVSLEAITVHLVYFEKSPDYRERYLQSIKEMDLGAEFEAVAKAILYQRMGGESAV